MAVKRFFNIREQFSDDNGVPLNGGKLFAYVAGSSTKQDTFNSSAGSVANTNPLVLDAGGRLQTEVWGTTGVSYKLVLTTSADTDPPASPIWTEDNIEVVNDTTVTIDQWVSGPAPTFVSTTSFTLVGDQTTVFHVGRRVRTTNSGGTIYSRITASVFTSLTTVTVVNDSGVLDSGLSAVSYALISAENTSIPVIDEDDMASDSATLPPSQQSVKAYVDAGDIVLATPQATTSGTSIDFTGIPAGVKKIVVSFVGVSTTSTDPILVQLGDAGGLETSVYTSGSSEIIGASTTQAQSSSGFTIPAGASNPLHGTLTINLENSSAFTWVSSGVLHKNAATSFPMIITAGSKSLSAVLTQVSLTTATGFTAGEANISYE